jgi:peptidoglycan-binding protein ArfA
LRQAAASTDSGRAPESHRRSLGLPWLIAVVVIPLLVATIGHVAFERPGPVTGPAGALPTLAPSGKPAPPKLSLAPLSITRSGNDLTLSGDFPDDSAKAALMTALRGSLPPGVNVVDQIHINPNVDALDFAKAGPIFKDTGSIPDFSLTVNGDTITLAGTAASQDQKNAIDQRAVRTWPNLKLVDKLAVNGPVPSPGPAAPGQCADLQSAIAALTGGPITFGNDGFSLTPTDVQILTQVADRLKPCAAAHATVNGYADNSGVESINIALSSQRAQTVVDFLVAHGVAVTQLVVKGLGSVNPVAPNDTPDGRAKNRRVEIVVS